MQLTDTAAAYGVFQVVFADLADHLAVATFRLRERREPDISLEDVFKQQFSCTLKQFRQELCRVDDNCSPASEHVRDLLGVCKVAADVANWRNDRIHARVRMTDSGYALYDKRTGKRLELYREQIEKNIEQTIKAIVELEASVQHVVGQIEWEEEFEKMFRELTER